MVLIIRRVNSVTPSHHIPSRNILILPPAHQAVCFLPATYQNTACIILLPLPNTCAVYQILLPFSTLIMDILIMRFSAASCYCLPPRPKYSSQHHDRESPQSSLFPSHLRDQVTSTHSKNKLYSSAYFSVCPFDSRREDKQF